MAIKQRDRIFQNKFARNNHTKKNLLNNKIRPKNPKQAIKLVLQGFDKRLHFSSTTSNPLELSPHYLDKLRIRIEIYTDSPYWICFPFSESRGEAIHSVLFEIVTLIWFCLPLNWMRSVGSLWSFTCRYYVWLFVELRFEISDTWVCLCRVNDMFRSMPALKEEYTHSSGLLFAALRSEVLKLKMINKEN